MRRTYTTPDWKRLGRYVSRARHLAGYPNTNEWADAVQRSSRMLLGLERGESVGPGTLSRIEDVLGWHRGACFEILDGVDPDVAISSDPGAVGGRGQTPSGYVSGPGRKVEGGGTDDEVLRAIQQMQRDMLEMERRLSERLDRLEQPGT